MESEGFPKNVNKCICKYTVTLLIGALEKGTLDFEDPKLSSKETYMSEVPYVSSTGRAAEMEECKRTQKLLFEVQG